MGHFMRLVIGAPLILGGMTIWNSRLNFDTETVVRSRLANRLQYLSAGQTADLEDECEIAKSGQGWILFVLDATLTSDNQFRTFFETAEERVGLWVEYDSGLLRLGLGLGPDNDASNIGVPIRLVRKDERIAVLIAVKQQETRVISNAVDIRTKWPGDLAPIWQCDAVQFADDSRELTGGYKCEGCDIRLRYVTGRNIDEVDDLLESLSNVRRFQTKSWLGTALSVLGGLIILNKLPNIRRPRKTKTRSLS